MTLKHPIGIFGGTFDPVHLGHLKIAEQLLNELKLSTIHLIPNRHPPHRPKPIASPEDRLAMLRIATLHRADLIVNDIEIARPPPSYAIDTLRTLRALIPTQPLCLILGTDAFNSFNQWFKWEDILKYVHIVVINRPGNPISLKQQWLHDLMLKHQITHPNHLGETPAGKIYIKEINPIPLSASEIREKISAGEDVSEYLPPKVWHYIQQHHLYKGVKGK